MLVHVPAPGPVEPVLGAPGLEGLLPTFDVLHLLVAAVAVAATAAPGLVPLYRRLTRAGILDPDARRATFEFFLAHPGATVGKASAALGLDYKTVLHHARVLEEFHLVRTAREGRIIRYTVVHAHDPARATVRANGTPFARTVAEDKVVK